MRRARAAYERVIASGHRDQSPAAAVALGSMLNRRADCDDVS
jgi:hypothetical protein